MPDNRISGVAFTGSTQTAQIINRMLASRDGPIVPLIAETGGLNAMIVDSSPLLEQVTKDVLISAFRSGGQRCSALRVLFIQEDIAEKQIKMICNAAQELKIGDPIQLSTDIGPIIDKASIDMLTKHTEKISRDEDSNLLSRYPWIQILIMVISFLRTFMRYKNFAIKARSVWAYFTYHTF